MKQNSNSISMEIDMLQFVDWFMDGFGINRGFSSDFYYENYRRVITAFDTMSGDWSLATCIPGCESPAAESALGYSILRIAYERHACWEIKENIIPVEACGKTATIYAYHTTLIFSGQKYDYGFFTPVPYWVFTEERNCRIRLEQEWLKATEKTVLCLESKPALTHQAMCEIADAIREGYYISGDNPENFFNDFDNVTEIREDWMQYKTRCSADYFYGECNAGISDLCDQSIVTALKWFKTGYETGALQLVDDLSCPVLNKLGFEYKMY